MESGPAAPTGNITNNNDTNAKIINENNLNTVNLDGEIENANKLAESRMNTNSGGANNANNANTTPASFGWV